MKRLTDVDLTYLENVQTNLDELANKLDPKMTQKHRHARLIDSAIRQLHSVTIEQRILKQKEG